MKSFTSFILTSTLLFIAFTGATAQKAEANIRKAYDALNQRDYAAFLTVCAADFTEYSAGPEPIKTPEAAIEAYKMYFAAFPDLKIEIQEIAKGMDGRFFLKVMISGTNTGSFGMLPPTGKSVSMTDVDIVELNSKNLATSHWSANSNGMLNAIGYGSITNPATNVVMQVYEKFSKGDVPGILAMTTDDVVFDIQDDVLNTGSKTYNGKQGVANFFKELSEKNQYTKFQPWRFIADGDDVIILVSAEYKNIPSGKSYTTNYVHQFKIINGKIASFKGVADLQRGNSVEMAKTTIRNLFAAMDAGQSDKILMYCSSDFMITNPILQAPSPLAVFQGLQQSMKASFPDMQHEIVSISTDGHYVTTLGNFKGTNTGAMMGNPPTGNKVNCPFLCLDELDASGKVKSRNVQFDMKTFESQIMGGMTMTDTKK